jgi:hypothetical protein
MQWLPIFRCPCMLIQKEHKIRREELIFNRTVALITGKAGVLPAIHCGHTLFIRAGIFLTSETRGYASLNMMFIQYHNVLPG